MIVKHTIIYYPITLYYNNCHCVPLMLQLIEESWLLPVHRGLLPIQRPWSQWSSTSVVIMIISSCSCTTLVSSSSCITMTQPCSHLTLATPCSSLRTLPTLCSGLPHSDSANNQDEKHVATRQCAMTCDCVTNSDSPKYFI